MVKFIHCSVMNVWYVYKRSLLCAVPGAVLYCVCASCTFRNPLLTKVYDSIKVDTMIVRVLNDAVSDTEVYIVLGEFGTRICDMTAVSHIYVLSGYSAVERGKRRTFSGYRICLICLEMKGGQIKIETLFRQGSHNNTGLPTRYCNPIMHVELCTVL